MTVSEKLEELRKHATTSVEKLIVVITFEALPKPKYQIGILRASIGDIAHLCSKTDWDQAKEEGRFYAEFFGVPLQYAFQD